MRRSYIISTLCYIYNAVAHSFLTLCPAVFFLKDFSSFEAGIADAIPSFKWRKLFAFRKKKSSPELNYMLNWASTPFLIWFGLKLVSKRTQGLYGSTRTVTPSAVPLALQTASSSFLPTHPQTCTDVSVEPEQRLIIFLLQKIIAT